VVVEKVLARGERLPGQWAVHGTTGYEFLNLVGRVFVERRHLRMMTAIHATFTGERAGWEEVAYASRQLILEVSLAGELAVLGHALKRLAGGNRYARDFTRRSLTDALREVIASFPVYRTYVEDQAEVSLQDRACVEVAVAAARRRNPAIGAALFDFVRDVLLLRAPDTVDDEYRRDQRRLVMKFQQVTAPVTAKGLEDTAFYRHTRLVSLNEVGGDPDQFGVTVEEFHAQCAARRERWPGGLSATATHDTKRGEDVRVRIHALSELPRAWRAAVARWHRWNRRHATRLDGLPAPSGSDEYMLYQTLVGTWPPDAAGRPAGAEGQAYVERIQAYMLKAVREAKVRTSWVNPDLAYEEAVRSFVAGALQPGPRNRFPGDLAAFTGPVARLGAVTGLGQTLLKVTAPGVPDFYQGTELWDLALVDPDNRRPVDFAARAAALDDLERRWAAGAPLAADLLAAWPDGRVKLFVAWRALAVRRARPGLFAEGDYVPLGVTGAAAERVCAFARRAGDRAAVVVVPRLVARLTDGGARWPLGPETWADTAVVLPDEPRAPGWTDAFTGLRRQPSPGAPAALAVADLLDRFPCALLEPDAAREAAGR
jgi:(1->4)-alpha-D-glucan 1-alpha-D-glucosylmutase